MQTCQTASRCAQSVANTPMRANRGAVRNLFCVLRWLSTGEAFAGIVESR